MNAKNSNRTMEQNESDFQKQKEIENNKEHSASTIYDEIKSIFESNMEESSKRDLIIARAIQLGTMHNMHVLSSTLDQTVNHICTFNFNKSNETTNK